LATTLFAGGEFIYVLAVYYTGALIVSTILLVITIKKNRFEGEYQLYARILDAQLNFKILISSQKWLRVHCMPRD
jgi:hypothetical protein